MVEYSAENFRTQFHSYEIATVKFPINGSRTWNNNTKQLVTLGMNAMIGKPLQSNLKCARFYDKYQIQFKLMDQWSTSLHAPKQKEGAFWQMTQKTHSWYEVLESLVEILILVWSRMSHVGWSSLTSTRRWILYCDTIIYAVTKIPENPNLEHG